MKKQIIVTTSWDDGHKLDLRLAGLLKKYRIKGTFYVSPENREFKKSDLLTNPEIKALGKNFEIGAHTMTHPRLTKINKKQAFREITESKKCLEKLINKKIKCFCYPGGDYSQINAKQVKIAGFKLGRTTETFKYDHENPYEVPTTINAYDHWLDVWKIFLFVNFNPISFWKYYRHWDNLAEAMFDRVMKEGGVYHLWGHSWEINDNNGWVRLEKIFKYISNKKGLRYVTNGGLV